MKHKYTELLTLTGVVFALDAGEHVEAEYEDGWHVPTAQVIDMALKYRLVEETEETPEPQQGDEIMVFSRALDKPQRRKFIAFWGDKVIAEFENGKDARPWNYWKPVPTENPTAREFAIYVLTSGRLVATYADEGFPVHNNPQGTIEEKLISREVLKDET